MSVRKKKQAVLLYAQYGYAVVDNVVFWWNKSNLWRHKYNFFPSDFPRVVPDPSETWSCRKRDRIYTNNG